MLSPTPKQVEACWYCGHGWPVPSCGCEICGNEVAPIENAQSGRTLFQVLSGERLKRDGIASVEAASEEITKAVRSAVMRVAQTGGTFTADHVYRLLESEGLIDNEFRVNAIGAAFNFCAKKGAIRWTGRTASSTRKGARSRLIRVWEVAR
jgi:hypothetical protein